jgi:hypothetical protein
VTRQRARGSGEPASVDRTLTTLRDLPELPTAGDRELARRALVWGRELLDERPGLSEFERELIAVAAGGHADEPRQQALVCALVAVYAQRRARSRHLGEPGLAVILTVLVERVVLRPSARHGVVRRNELIDPFANRLVWWQTQGPPLEIGEVVRLRGRVARHTHFGSVAVTVLSDCRRADGSGGAAQPIDLACRDREARADRPTVARVRMLRRHHYLLIAAASFAALSIGVILLAEHRGALRALLAVPSSQSASATQHGASSDHPTTRPRPRVHGASGRAAGRMASPSGPLVRHAPLYLALFGWVGLLALAVSTASTTDRRLRNRIRRDSVATRSSSRCTTTRSRETSRTRSRRSAPPSASATTTASQTANRSSRSSSGIASPTPGCNGRYAWFARRT